MLEALNFNTYGFTFDAASTGPGETVWVSILNQDESHTNMIRRLEPLMPERFNNVLISTTNPAKQFCVLPYSIKYLCL